MTEHSVGLCAGCPLFDPAVMVLEPSQTVFENIADRLRTEKNGPYHPPAAGSRCVLPVVWQNYRSAAAVLLTLCDCLTFRVTQ